MAHAAGFVHRELEHFLCARGKIQPCCGGTLSGASHTFYQFFNAALIQAEVAQHTPRYTAFFTHQTEQQVLSPNITML